MKRVVHCGILLCMCSLLLLGACGVSSSGDSTRSMDGTSTLRGRPSIRPISGEPPKEGRPVQWKVLGQPEGRLLRVGTGFLSWCVEIPRSKPRITAVRESSRREDTIFTVYVRGGYQRGCAEVSVRPEVIIKMDHPLADERLYDGSKKPPVKRWPE